MLFSYVISGIVKKNSKYFSVHHNLIERSAPFSPALLVTTCGNNLASSREISRDKLLFHLTLLSRIQTSSGFSFGVWLTLSGAYCTCLSSPTVSVLRGSLCCLLTSYCWTEMGTSNFTPLRVSG